MRTETVTVKKAMLVGYLSTLLPFFAILFSGCFFGIRLLEESVTLGATIIVGSIVGSYIICSIAYCHWLVWAFHNVDHPRLLYFRALRANFIKPRESWYNKLNVTWGIDKEKYEQVWEIAEQHGDVESLANTLPADRIVQVKYSTTSFIITTVMLVFVSAGLILAFLNKEDLTGKGKLFLYLGPIGVGMLLYECVMQGVKRGKLALQFTPDYLDFFGEFIPWDAIMSLSVYKEGKHDFKVSITSLKGELVDGKGKIFSSTKDVTALDVSPDRLDELFTIYRELYGRS